MTTSPDVLVIGAGAIGVTVTLELIRQGASTVLVEAAPHVGAGCSAGSAGLVCPSHAAPLANGQAVRDGIRWMFNPTSPFYLRPRPSVIPWLFRFLVSARRSRVQDSTALMLELASASLRMHEAYVESGIPTTYESHGILDVFEREKTFESAKEKLGSTTRRSIGLPFQVMSAEETRRLIPSLRSEIAGGILFTEEGHCDSQQYVEAVAEAAEEGGADLRLDCPITEIRRTDHKIVSVHAGTEKFTPGTVVIAAGAWSRELARQVGIRIPLEAGKGYHVDVEAAPDDPSIPVFLSEARVIATPLQGRLRLSGTLELSGLDTTINHTRANAVRSAVEGVLDGIRDRKTLETWSGLRPCPPDGLPLLGRTELVSNLVLATGHAMMGVAMAPMTGRLIGELLAGQKTSLDLEPFNPDRFKPSLRNSARAALDPEG